MTPSPLHVIELSGVLLILIAFAMNLFKEWSTEHFLYLWFNIVGCALLTYYCFIIESYPLMILQLSWGIFAIIKYSIIKLTDNKEG